MEAYLVWFFLAGLIWFGAAWLPHVTQGTFIPYTVILIAAGALLFSIPGIEAPDPPEHLTVVERFTELTVIIALMGAGLKIDRHVGLRRWATTWRLLGPTMLISFGLFALTGWWLLGLDPAAAILLGAVLAPTDPVLAADVQTAEPMTGEAEPRFALTSEAGLNDGLAFPLTNMAIAMALYGAAPENWLGHWLLVDVLYKIAAAGVMGVAVGLVMAYLIYSFPSDRRLADTREGYAVASLTLISYSVTEFIHGYGFLAVFVAARALRRYVHYHEFHRTLNQYSDDLERMLTAGGLFLFGGAIVSGILGDLTWQAALAGILFVLVVRPLAGMIGLAGSRAMSRPEKVFVAFFGIRGVGSFFYLAFALRHADFAEPELLWSTVSFVVLVSIVLHGAGALPAMNFLERTTKSAT